MSEHPNYHYFFYPSIYSYFFFIVEAMSIAGT